MPAAIEKAAKDARKHLMRVPLTPGQGSIPHEVTGDFCGSRIRLIPASAGTGIIAGAVRARRLRDGGHQATSSPSPTGPPTRSTWSRPPSHALAQLRTKERAGRFSCAASKSRVFEALQPNLKHRHGPQDRHQQGNQAPVRSRIGRGIGSGSGKTSGRGHKGWGARSGASRRPGYEGGQMPIYRRVPKRGFTNARFRTDYTDHQRR